MSLRLTIPSLHQKATEKYEAKFQNAVDKRNSLPKTATDAQRKTAQDEVDRYFSLLVTGDHSFNVYTGSPVFPSGFDALVRGYADSKQMITPPNVKRLLADVVAAKPRKGMSKRKAQLVALLERAVELDEGLACSW